MASTANDPYEIQTPAMSPAAGPAATPAATPAAGPAASEPGTDTTNGGGSRTSVLLWTSAAILAGANTALSIAGYPIIGSFAGGGVLGCLTVLLVRYLRRRR